MRRQRSLRLAKRAGDGLIGAGLFMATWMNIWHTIHCGLQQFSDAAGTPSVPDVARRHAEAHRWFESERSGRDVGPEAYRQWKQRYWRTFCRWRYLEHLLGICRYREFSDLQFGSLSRCEGWSLDSSMDFALQQMFRDDREQLEVLFEAPESLPRNRLLQVLSLLDVNGARLTPPEWAEA